MQLRHVCSVPAAAPVSQKPIAVASAARAPP